MESIRLSFDVSYDLLQVIIMGGRGGRTPTTEIKCFILEIATYNWVCWQTEGTSMKYHYGGISSGSALFFLNCS